MKSGFWLAVLLAVAGCQQASTTLQGTTSSGGGSPYKDEFKDAGRTVVRRLKARGVSQVAGVSVDAFEVTLETLKLTTTEDFLRKDGEPVDALNFPSESKVLLSLVRWAPHMNFRQKRKLVVHEVLGLLKKPDKDFKRTNEILGALGYLEEVDIREFQVMREVAQRFIEKMPWRAGEISVDDKYYPESRTTYYTARRGTHPDTGVVQCRKYETFIKDYEGTSHFCWIVGQAKVNDQGTIVVQLGPEFTEEQRHPLWRLFDDLKGPTFDYGVVRGDRRYLELELFP